jgi:hypothetical protein
LLEKSLRDTMGYKVDKKGLLLEGRPKVVEMKF